MSGKLVVLRALKLGDLLVAVPALRAIRRFWPEHRILLACAGWLRPVAELARCPGQSGVDGVDGVDDVLPTSGLDPPEDSRWWEAARRPDVAVNMHGHGPESTRLLDALEPARRVGHRGHGWDGPEWTLDGELHERERWCRMLWAHDIPADPEDLLLARPPTESPAPDTVIVHPGAAFGSRRWPAARFAEVARALAEAGHQVLVTGNDGERHRAADVARRAGLGRDAVLAGGTSLPELMSLVAQARLVVCADTGIAHLSYAFATPSVVLFGPVPAAQWGPPRSGPHVALSADELRVGDPFADEPDPAILGVATPVVLDACERLLAAPRRATQRSMQ